jgi:tetratricopeptide (TPR) repeat protein
MAVVPSRRVTLCLTLLLLDTGLVPAACQPCEEARSLMESAQFNQAAVLLKKAAKADKKSAEVRGLLAVAYARLDERREAVEALDGFFKLDPAPELVREVGEAVITRLGLPKDPDLRFDLPEGATAPVILFTSKANYPTMAADVGLERDVVVQGFIGTNGRAERLELVRIGDWALLQTAGFADEAMGALQRWRFFPAMKEGVPVPVQFRAVVSFRLIR